MGNHDLSPAMRCQVFNLNQFLSMTKKLIFETKKQGNKLEICSSQMLVAPLFLVFTRV